MKTFIKKIYFALFVVLGLGIFFVFREFLPLKSAVILGILTMTAITFLSEILLPYRSSWRKSHGDRARDFFFTVLLFPVVVEACQWISFKVSSEFSLSLLRDQSLAIQVLMGLLSGEFFFYLFHRISHENPTIWKFHASHHSVKRLYWMNAGTFNTFDLLLNFLFYCLPVALLGGSPEALSYILYFSALTGLLEHANIDFKAGFLNYIFNTAELHRWHHSSELNESMKNYGKALVIWDHFFRTHFYKPTDHVAHLGLKPKDVL